MAVGSIAFVCCRRTHGADQLSRAEPDCDVHLHRRRARLVRTAVATRVVLHRARDLGDPAVVESAVAETFSLRSCGVALAIPHSGPLAEASAYNAVCAASFDTHVNLKTRYPPPMRQVAIVAMRTISTANSVNVTS